MAFRRLWISFVFLSLFACAIPQNRSETLRSWLGAPVDELIASWGAPDREYRLDNGGRVLEFYDEYETAIYDGVKTTKTCRPTTYETTGTVQQSGILGGNYTYNEQTKVRQNCINRITGSKKRYVTEICKNIIATDKDGLIVRTSFSGNGCY